MARRKKPKESAALTTMKQPREGDYHVTGTEVYQRLLRRDELVASFPTKRGAQAFCALLQKQYDEAIATNPINPTLRSLLNEMHGGDTSQPWDD